VFGVPEQPVVVGIKSAGAAAAYGRQIARWVAKALEAAQPTAEVVVLLLPSRTDTRWFNDAAANGEVRFLRGRVRFGAARSGAPFPSCLVLFRFTNSVTLFAPQTA
jgi:site-specific DNA-methyltransferase (adenine-specific)